MNTGFKIKRVTDGAIIAALYAVIFLASRFIGGLLEGYLYFLIPIPLIVYGYKYDLISSITTSLATLVISFFIISNPFSVLFYILPGLIGGSFIPLVMKKKINTIWEIIIMSLISLIVNLLSSVVFGYLFNYDIVEDTILLVDEMMNFLSSLGINNVSYTIFKAIMVSFIPSVLVITAIVEGIVIYLLSHLLLIRLKLESKFELRHFFAIEKFHPVIAYIYLVIVGLMIFSLFNIAKANDAMFVVYSVILNIGVIYSLVMVVQGVIFIAKYSKVKNMRWLYILSVLSLFFFPPIMITIGVIQNIFHLSNRLY